jgi:adenylosuccinate synthase
MPGIVVEGLQRGDEGKGHIVDLLAENADLVVRYCGALNAGHKMLIEGIGVIATNQLPSGIIRPNTLNILGNGVLFDPIAFQEEIYAIQDKGIEVSPKNVMVSHAAHLIMQQHVILDRSRENTKDAQGSTVKGISYAAADKYKRSNLRAEDIKFRPLSELASLAFNGFLDINMPEINHHKPLSEVEVVIDGDLIKHAENWAEKASEVKPYIVTNTVDVIRGALQSNKTVLFEGAQAAILDINHGYYPDVTSSHTLTDGAMGGAGFPHQHLDRIVGVVKAFKSHVGRGDLMTQIENEKLEDFLCGEQGSVDGEYGTVSGRKRRLGYFDLAEARQAVWLSGATELAIIKMDILENAAGIFGPTMKVAEYYERSNGEKLMYAPSSKQERKDCKPVYKNIPVDGYVEYIEEQLQVPVTMVGMGPERNQVIMR